MRLQDRFAVADLGATLNRASKPKLRRRIGSMQDIALCEAYMTETLPVLNLPNKMRQDCCVHDDQVSGLLVNPYAKLCKRD